MGDAQNGTDRATVASLWHYPIKGFTPQPLQSARVEAGQHFPFDRMYAIEDGPSGFDPDAPAYVPKIKFAVLAKMASIARIKTHYDIHTAYLEAGAPGHIDFVGELESPTSRAHFAQWLTGVIGEQARGRLSVIAAPSGHRFMDSAQGFVSLINLASLRDLATRMGCAVDLRRFRANIYVDGWPAWAERDRAGGSIVVGGVTFEIIKATIRCLATHADPDLGERNLDVLRALFDNYGDRFCGVYLAARTTGQIAVGDGVTLMEGVPTLF